MDIPMVNIQALLALAMFIASLFIARIVGNIRRGKWPGGELWILYLRILLGFLLAAAITFGFYSFAGVSIIG